MPTDLLMVRHGQSTWNALGRWQGHADPPLSELGTRQAIAAAESVPANFDIVISSDLRRAARTAELATGSDFLQIPAFRERSAGEWEGLTRAELTERWPDWEQTGWRPEGFETDVDVLERVLPALSALVGDGGTDRTSRILIVTHGGVIRALDRHLNAPPVAIANLTGRWYHHNERWRLGDYVALAPEVTDSDVE